MANRFVEVCKKFIPRGKYTHTIKYYFKKYVLPIIIVLLSGLVGYIVHQVQYLNNEPIIIYKDREVIVEMIVKCEPHIIMRDRCEIGGKG